MPSLRIDWINRKDAERAVMRWHYSKAMPPAKLACLGVWEDGVWIGAVIFGGGAAPEIGSPFGLKRFEVCELVRVALGTHKTPVTRVLAICLKMIRAAFPSLKAIVSFADGGHGHHGGIYQGGGWVYVGTSSSQWLKVHGVIRHPKTLHSIYGIGGQSVAWLQANVDPRAERITMQDKYKYVFPLCSEVASRLKPLPYPKRAVSTVASAPPVQGGEDGSKPITALSQ